MDDRALTDQLFINIPVTAKEHALLATLAAEDGLPLIDYVRSCILPGPIDPVDIMTRRLTMRTVRRP